VIGLAANRQLSGPVVDFHPGAEMAVQPGRFFHVICRELLGTGTATETYRWVVQVDGYFE
jgi:hypothetical protein